MVKKKSKLAWPWRVTGYIFKGLGLGIWYTLKGIWWAISKIFTSIYKVTAKKVKEQSDKKKLLGMPSYSKKAEFNPLEVLESISGDYKVSERRIHEDSIIALIFGKRGSGKSALGFRLLENIHNKTNRHCFVLGVSQTNMPSWINPIDNIESAPEGSAVLVDEGAIAFNARESMSKANKGLAGILAIARHKNLTVFFITQNTGMIDKNVLKLADMLLVKQGSLLQLEMERPEIKKFYEKSEAIFSKLGGDKRQYAYIIDGDFEGAISHQLPSFWTESLSKNHSEDKE